MKINPIGISAYQQISRSGNSGPATNTDNSAAAKLTVQPQSISGPSRISVKPRITDAGAALTPPELKALDNLLKIINEKSATNAGYAKDNRATENPSMIGRIVDVKV